jgi:hypothetical protein
MHENKGIIFTNRDARKYIETHRNPSDIELYLAKGSSKPHGFSSGSFTYDLPK